MIKDGRDEVIQIFEKKSEDDTVKSTVENLAIYKRLDSAVIWGVVTILSNYCNFNCC